MLRLAISAVFDVTGKLDVKAGSDITVNNTIKPDDSSKSNNDTDAAVAVSILTASPTMADITGGDMNVTGAASFIASNTINSTTIADGAVGNGGATVGFTLILGDTAVNFGGGTLDAATITLSATSDRTITTLASEHQRCGCTFGGDSNKNESRESPRRSQRRRQYQR